MKILLLGSQHGNELLGSQLIAYIQKNNNELLQYITFKIGNPKAHKLKLRYTETDMNRSYSKGVRTYESRRATYINRYIERSGYDIVLDLHTTRCVQPPCMIIEQMNSKNIPFIQSSSIKYIVLLQDPIVKTSLIGTRQDVISIEVNEDEVNNRLLEAMCQDLKRYIYKVNYAGQRNTYTVSEMLLKSDVSKVEANRFVNFKRTSKGYYPILTGNNTYKKNTHYLGFKATKLEVITL